MSVDRITGENLAEIRSGLRKFSPSDWDAYLKFVLVLGPDGKGYFRADSGPEHPSTLGRLHDYLRVHGDDIVHYKLHGGGFVSIWHSENREGKTRLKFHGSSSNFGRFDEALLKVTLDEVLDKERFTYSIEL